MLASMRLARCVIWITILIVACAPEKLAGTDLGTDPAPDLTLTDGVTGAPLTLSSLRGNAVALTFLYTQCPDTCPLVAERFRITQRELGADADHVRFIAVSVDPTNDTPAAVQQFTRAHSLERNWHYLVGTRAQLEPVWKSYFVGVEPSMSGPLVGHTDAIFLIDPRGRARVLLHASELDTTLTKDLRILLREK
jgi:protein SCO1